jgi:ubiquinone/menaquinone biosynthesis C-methylase UbiE
MEPAATARLWGACCAALYDPFLALGERRGMAALRRDLLSSACGRVLEVGAGTGRNLSAYPCGLDALVLTEPDPSMLARLRRSVRRSGRDARVVAAGAEALPFADASFDTVVSTMVLCTVDRPDAAASELRRVLRPGGRLLFIEHVRAGDAKLARRQDRLAAAWRMFAAGCNCNRDTMAVLRGQFATVGARTAVWRGMPRIVAPLLVGHAAGGSR